MKTSCIVVLMMSLVIWIALAGTVRINGSNVGEIRDRTPSTWAFGGLGADV